MWSWMELSERGYWWTGIFPPLNASGANRTRLQPPQLQVPLSPPILRTKLQPTIPFGLRPLQAWAFSPLTHPRILQLRWSPPALAFHSLRAKPLVSNLRQPLLGQCHQHPPLTSPNVPFNPLLLRSLRELTTPIPSPPPLPPHLHTTLPPAVQRRPPYPLRYKPRSSTSACGCENQCQKATKHTSRRNSPSRASTYIAPKLQRSPCPPNTHTHENCFPSATCTKSAASHRSLWPIPPKTLAATASSPMARPRNPPRCTSTSPSRQISRYHPSPANRPPPLRPRRASRTPTRTNAALTTRLLTLTPTPSAPPCPRCSSPPVAAAASCCAMTPTRPFPRARRAHRPSRTRCGRSRSRARARCGGWPARRRAGTRMWRLRMRRGLRAWKAWRGGRAWILERRSFWRRGRGRGDGRWRWVGFSRLVLGWWVGGGAWEGLSDDLWKAGVWERVFELDMVGIIARFPTTVWLFILVHHCSHCIQYMSVCYIWQLLVITIYSLYLWLKARICNKAK